MLTLHSNDNTLTGAEIYETKIHKPIAVCVSYDLNQIVLLNNN